MSVCCETKTAWVKKNGNRTVLQEVKKKERMLIWVGVRSQNEENASHEKYCNTHSQNSTTESLGVILLAFNSWIKEWLVEPSNDTHASVFHLSPTQKT